VKGLYEVLLTTMKNGGSRALDLEISKVRQYAALEAARVRSPDTSWSAARNFSWRPRDGEASEPSAHGAAG
jgi:hypothetical protein